MKPTLSLGKLMVSDADAEKLTAVVEFKDGMYFTVHYTTANALQTALSGAKYLQWNNAKKSREEIVDVDRFAANLVKHCLTGWKGVTIRKIAKYTMMNLKAVSEEELDTEIPFTREDAAMLLKRLEGFDSWLMEVARDPSIYRDAVQQEAITKN